MAELTFDANNFLKVTTAGSGGGSTVQITDTSGNALNSNGSGALDVAIVSGGSTGTLSNNTAAPVADNTGVLPAIANAANPTWTEGFQVLESVDLSGNQRVKVNAPLPAGTNVIGHVISDTGSTTAVTQTTASNLNATVVSTKTDNNLGPDGNNLGVLPAVANAVAPTRAEGNQVLLSTDLNGSLRTMSGNIPEATAAWTSATTVNTAVTMTVTGYGYVAVTLNQGTTITGGVVTFEVSNTTAFTNAYLIDFINLSQGATAPLASTYTLQANTNVAFLVPVAGFAAFRIRLSTVISGTGTVNVGVAGSNANSTALNVAVSTITSGVRVESNAAVANLADNQASTTFFTSSTNVNDPMSVGQWMYGGAFSGTTNAALLGWSKARTPVIFKTVSTAASGNTALWTPGSGNKFRLLKLFIQVTDNATLAAAGVLVVDLQDASTTTNLTFSIFVPQTAPTGIIGDIGEIQLDLGSFGYLSSAANNVLNVNLSSALATGVCRVIAMGVEE